MTNNIHVASVVVMQQSSHQKIPVEQPVTGKVLSGST